MSKKFKNKLCVYCSNSESTNSGDHIFAREFFLIDERGNLPKVPACKTCNDAKSKLEHYLTAVMPFGGLHSDSYENLTTLLPPRLTKNQRLNSEILDGATYDKLDNSLKAIPFNGQIYVDIFSLIAKGLSYFHWDDYIKPETFIFTTCATSHCLEIFDTYIFSLNTGKNVTNSIGKSNIHYTGIQSIDNSQISFWKIMIYGGLKVSDNNDVSNTMLIITAPEKYKDKITALFS